MVNQQGTRCLAHSLSQLLQMQWYYSPFTETKRHKESKWGVHTYAARTPWDPVLGRSTFSMCCTAPLKPSCNQEGFHSAIKPLTETTCRGESPLCMKITRHAVENAWCKSFWLRLCLKHWIMITSDMDISYTSKFPCVHDWSISGLVLKLQSSACWLLIISNYIMNSWEYQRLRRHVQYAPTENSFEGAIHHPCRTWQASHAAHSVSDASAAPRDCPSLSTTCC